MSEFDIVIVGGGPGGYAAALYGASAGLTVALVEDDAVGGTCLNRGCIPAKALLQTAEVYRTASHASDFGVVADTDVVFKADWSKVADRTNGIVDRLVGGLSGLLKRRKVEVIRGRGRLVSSGAVSVEGQELSASRGVILATGSAPRTLPGFSIDGDRIVTSDHATRSDRLPERVAVIGGGVIGVEFASAFTDVGVETTLFEADPRGVLPVGPDAELADVLAKQLAARGTTIRAGTRVEAPEITASGVVLSVENEGRTDKIEVDQVLVAVGRRPLSEDLGLDDAGVGLSDKGFIEVDTAMATTRQGIYAVGDVIETPGLAHVAYAEAIAAIQHILGEDPAPVDYERVPWIVYTHPEVAWVGYTERAAKAAGFDVEVHKHKFAGNGRAMIIGETEGLVKVVAEKGGPLLGVHIVGPWASELLAENYLAVNWQALPAEVAALIHPHPSLSEAVGETMLALTGRSLHG